MVVFGDRHGERAVEIAPVGQQFVERARIDDRAGEDMGADLGALFEDADRELAPGGLGELLQADRRGEAGRAGADDHHVIGHRTRVRPFTRSSGRLLSSQAANVWRIRANLAVDQPAPRLAHGGGMERESEPSTCGGGERAPMVARSGRRHADRRGAARLAAPERQEPRRPPPRPRAPRAGRASRPARPLPAPSGDERRLPFAAPAAPRICPAGDPAAGLMILADMPTARIARRHLLSGEAGACSTGCSPRSAATARPIYLAACLLPALADRELHHRERRSNARCSPATISGWSRPRRCSCSATPAPRRCSAFRRRRRAAVARNRHASRPG